MIKFFNVDKQYQQDRDVYLDLADQVYSSGQVINGPFCRKLEESLKNQTGRKYCVLTASCTDALAFVGSALMTQVSNLYLFPEISFPATDNGFSRESPGSCTTRIYVDVDNSGNIDLDKLDNRLESFGIENQIIVVWVNLFGHCVDYDRILELYKKYPHVTFVEDAAQSIGASWKDIPSGAMGEASCFSFDPTKNLGAFGIGGAMLTDNNELADAVDLHRRPHTPKWINHGYNSQINEVDAAIVWWKLENRFDAWQKRRTDIAKYYIDNLNVECVVPHKDSTSAWHKFVVKHDNRNALKSNLEQSGIETKVHYAKTLDGEQNDFTQRCLSLPIYPELNDSEVEHIVKSTNTVLKLLS